MCEHLLGEISQLRKDPYWALRKMDVWPIVQDMIQRVERGDGNGTESSSGDEDNPAGKDQDALPESREHSLWGGRVQTLADSPHPRAEHERRVRELCDLWHSWVTVPNNLKGVAMDEELLAHAVLLPKKHCF